MIDYVNGLDDLRAGVDPIDRRSGSALRGRSGADDARCGVRRASRFHARSARWRRPSASIATSWRRARRRGSSRSTTRFFAAATPRKRFGPSPRRGFSSRFPRSCTRAPTDKLWRSLAALDAYRKPFEAVPENFTNTILLGSLLVPLGFSGYEPRRHGSGGTGNCGTPRRGVATRQSSAGATRCRAPGPDSWPAAPPAGHACARARAASRSSRRGIFPDALAWMEIHGNTPALVEHWAMVQSETRGFVGGRTGRRVGRAVARRRGAGQSDAAGEDDAGRGRRLEHARERVTRRRLLRWSCRASPDRQRSAA